MSDGSPNLSAFLALVDNFTLVISFLVGYQLTSAECFDLRTGRVVVDQYCHYYPENVKPKPKLQECNMEPCLDRLGSASPRESKQTKII